MASAAWERRNELARARGYLSYYDYRVHNYGRRPASEPRPTGERLARLRGHRSSSDFRAMMPRAETIVRNYTERKTGRINVVVIDENGDAHDFRLSADWDADAIDDLAGEYDVDYVDYTRDAGAGAAAA